MSKEKINLNEFKYEEDIISKEIDYDVPLCSIDMLIPIGNKNHTVKFIGPEYLKEYSNIERIKYYNDNIMNISHIINIDESTIIDYDNIHDYIDYIMYSKDPKERILEYSDNINIDQYRYLSDDYITESQIEEVDDKTYMYRDPVIWNYENNKIHIDKKIYVRDRNHYKIKQVDPNIPTLFRLVINSDIDNIVVFAGKGSNKPIRRIDDIVQYHGGTKEGWFHAKGDALVYRNGIKEKVDLHWFEHDDIGAIKRDIKYWIRKEYNVMTNFENIDILGQYRGKNIGYLTEGVIEFRNGDIIEDSEVVKFVEKCNYLLENEKYEEFLDYLEEDRIVELKEKNNNILNVVVGPKNGIKETIVDWIMGAQIELND